MLPCGAECKHFFELEQAFDIQVSLRFTARCNSS